MSVGRIVGWLSASAPFWLLFGVFFSNAAQATLLAQDPALRARFSDKLEISPPPGFANGDFTQLDGSGQPIGWQCSGSPEDAAASTCVLDHDPSSGKNTLVLHSGASAMVMFAITDHTSALSLEVTADREPSDFRDFMLASYAVGYQERSYAKALASAGPLITFQSAPVSSALGSLALVQISNSGSQDLRISNVGVNAGGANPGTKSGAILEAVHYTEIGLTAGTDPVEVTVPIPLDTASQVPLQFVADVEPKSAVDRISYERDVAGNVLMRVRLKGGDAVDKVSIYWRAILLTEYFGESERPSIYAADADPSIWLKATPDVDASYAGISSTAQSLAKGVTAPLDQMLAVTGWTSTNIRYGASTSLDATTVYNEKSGSCTGFGNLASALGRAIGMPTRTVANYLVGLPQQTHYINEFYLGTGLGWRRTEPQGQLASVPEDDYIPVRYIVPSTDETAAALDPAQGGVPLNSIIQFSRDSNRITAPVNPSAYFPTCPECDNAGMHDLDLRGNAADMTAVFAQARSAWERDLTQLLTAGAFDDATIAMRAPLSSVTSFQDLRDKVGQLIRPE